MDNYEPFLTDVKSIQIRKKSLRYKLLISSFLMLQMMVT